MKASPKKDLHLNVHIPRYYPLSDGEISVRFYLQEDVEVAHVNLDRSVCIHTPSHHDFKMRLYNELRILKEWRDRYYLKSTIDTHYDYLLTPMAEKDASCYLFTDIAHTFRKGDSGSFKYAIFSDYSMPGYLIGEQALVLEIGGHKCDWSNSVSNYPTAEGLFVFIEDEPIKRPFRIVNDWIDLERYLPQDFLTKLYRCKQDKKIPQILRILVGYRIADGSNIHWQLIKLKRNSIPIFGKKVAPKIYESSCISESIDWAKTSNSSYDRFFGRGGLSKFWTRKKILLIGTGAIGSGLANIFVRGGVRFLDLCDFDVIEPGNICRSEFYLIDNQFPKHWALKKHLDLVSPFVEIKTLDRFSKRRDGQVYKQTQQIFKEYDLIIDCTSDNELSYFLDGLALENVLNVSISNGSNEMVLVTGSNVASQKHVIFQKLDATEKELIYEGTGCWSPTFRAAYFDIHSQLNLLVQNLNYQYENFGVARTMIIKKEIIDNKVTLSTIDY